MSDNVSASSVRSADKPNTERLAPRPTSPIDKHRAEPVGSVDGEPAQREAAKQGLAFQRKEALAFVAMVAGLCIWCHDKDDGSPYEEVEEPSWSFVDSHDCLMNLIEQARRIQVGKRDSAGLADYDDCATVADLYDTQPAPSLSGVDKLLVPFRVTLNEEAGDRFTLVFDCMAEDAGHAAEQAENAYPGCNVLNCTEFVGNLPLNAWLRNLKPGDRVWWNDPDHHKSSGYYTIDSIKGDAIVFDDAILFVKNADGSSAEVLARELSAVKPENLQPVTDGDCGNGDLVGYAASKEEAIAVGNASLVDEVVDAYRVENITLRDGTQVDKAWVVLTHRIGEKARIRLTVDVTYDLNGVGAEAMCDRLYRMCVRAIDHDLLTADTDATVEAYSIDAARVEKPLTEEEVADWMRQRIESGQLHPEDIALRLARYGLMEVPAFVAEMRERMEVAEAG